MQQLLNNDEKTAEEIEMEIEAGKRRDSIRNIIRQCRRIETNVKTSKQEFKNEIQHYQNYLSDFKNYIDFK